MDWIRVAVTDGGGKWEPGTILRHYTANRAAKDIGWGERANFLCMAVTNLTDEIKAAIIKRAVKVDLATVLTPAALEDARANIHATTAIAARPVDARTKTPAYLPTRVDQQVKDIKING